MVYKWTAILKSGVDRVMVFWRTVVMRGTDLVMVYLRTVVTSSTDWVMVYEKTDERSKTEDWSLRQLWCKRHKLGNGLLKGCSESWMRRVMVCQRNVMRKVLQEQQRSTGGFPCCAESSRTV